MEKFLTQDRYNSLEKELEVLIKEKRPEVIKNIDQARSYGDLSENSEYEVAKKDQAFVEGRIKELEIILRDAKIIEDKSNFDTVEVGASVTLKDGKTVIEYKIVDREESDISTNKISDESPIGKEVLGKKVGDKVTIVTPKKTINYTVEKIF